MLESQPTNPPCPNCGGGELLPKLLKASAAHAGGTRAVVCAGCGYDIYRDARVAPPTEQEIAAAAAAVREGWDHGTRRLRGDRPPAARMPEYCERAIITGRLGLLP